MFANLISVSFCGLLSDSCLHFFADGFRKVKSEILEQSSWWEFRHPQFQRDQPHLLSEIKRSIHYAPDPLSGQEVSDLKAHVGSLQDRIDMLSEQVELLTNAVSEMRMGQDNTNNNNTLNVPAPAFGKKRKVTVKPHAAIPDMVSFSRMCSIDESRAITSNSSGLTPLAVPTGPDLQSMNIFRQNSGGSCVSLNEMIADGETADGKWGSSEEDLYFLDDLLDMPLTPAAPPSAVQVKVEPSYHETEELPMASVVAAPSAVAATGVQDLFSILESLSPELKIRFVDKLAEVMGNQLMNTATAAPASPVDKYHGSSSSSSSSSSSASKAGWAGEYNSKLPAQSTSSSSSSSSGSISPSRSFAQLTSGADAPYHLPSGVRAPEIALPLASAALGAFVMSSLNSLTSNQTRVQIKKEVV